MSTVRRHLSWPVLILFTPPVEAKSPRELTYAALMVPPTSTQKPERERARPKPKRMRTNMKAAKNLGAKIWGGVLVTICLLAVSTSARAQVSANPQVVNFGTQTVGSQSATTDIVLTNNSRRYVRIYGASLSGSAFSYSGPDGYLVLSPYQSVKGSVSFRFASAVAWARRARSSMRSEMAGRNV